MLTGFIESPILVLMSLLMKISEILITIMTNITLEVKEGGLKDENIIAYMYDYTSFNEVDPRPGIFINNPHDEDAYEGSRQRFG